MERGNLVLKKYFMAKFLANIAKQIATKNVNSACTLFFYQPKLSEKIKKLRKF
jgi:hypothetical protein